MHEPVLLNAVLEGLAPRAGGCYIDGTAGFGGHAAAILQASEPDGRLLAMDRDPEAVAWTQERLKPFGARAGVVCANHGAMARTAHRHGFDAVDGVLLDLGVSSVQLDTAERGFSFLRAGPLDMRMGPDAPMSAAEWLASLPDAASLADVLRRYGEEPRAHRIARAVFAEQQREPIRDTLRLARIVEQAVGGRRGAPTHPATRTFQALRIVVNGEVDSLPETLAQALTLLAPGGRLAVISFHSLEDRVVKRFFRTHEGQWEALLQGGRRWCGAEPRVVRCNRRVIRVSEAERLANPRARSARLRVAQRVVEDDAGTAGASADVTRRETNDAKA